jgi:hypothetical protein
MATVDKDFKVKNGLQVTGSGSFGGTLTVATPTTDAHAATKAYVDSVTGMTVSSTAPSSPTNGKQWLDTGTNRVNFYYNGAWYTQATIDDTNNLPQHIHDTAIDGTGFIVSQFYEGGSFNSPLGVGLDAGSPSSTEWTVVFDGGSVVDNFN